MISHQVTAVSRSRVRVCERIPVLDRRWLPKLADSHRIQIVKGHPAASQYTTNLLKDLPRGRNINPRHRFRRSR